MLLPADRSQRVVIGAGVVLTVAAATTELAGTGDVVRFAVAGLALAALAAVIGQAIESVGEHLGSGATGLLQSTLGNLPELFVGLFALDRGLVDVVRAALVGSILGTGVLVLGGVFVAGGLRHGAQRFDPAESRLYGSLLLLAVAALLVPTLAHQLDTPAARHATALSDVCAVVLIVVYACSIPFVLRLTRSGAGSGGGEAAGADGGGGAGAGGDGDGPPGAPLGTALGLLVAASVAAAVVSDWFTAALEPASRSLGLNQVFTGLVVVALASNAVEHVVGIRFALRAKPAYALSTTLSSPLQVALLLTPALVLAGNFIGPTPLTLVFPPLLVAALAISAVVILAVVYDGEYTWIEGVALVALYVMLAAAFWWG